MVFDEKTLEYIKTIRDGDFDLFSDYMINDVLNRSPVKKTGSILAILAKLECRFLDFCPGICNLKDPSACQYLEGENNTRRIYITKKIIADELRQSLTKINKKRRSWKSEVPVPTVNTTFDNWMKLCTDAKFVKVAALPIKLKKTSVTPNHYFLTPEGLEQIHKWYLRSLFIREGEPEEPEFMRMK